MNPDSDKDTEIISINVPRDQADFWKKYARYRNALAAAQGINLTPKWSRKSMIESTLQEQFAALVAQMQKMFDELGPLPDAADREAMAKYAKRAKSWSEKNVK